MSPGGPPAVLLREDLRELVVDLGQVAHRAATGEPGEQLGRALRTAPCPGDGQHRCSRPREEEQDNAEQARYDDRRPDVQGHIPGCHNTRIGPFLSAVNLATTGADQAFAGSPPAVITQPGR